MRDEEKIEYTKQVLAGILVLKHQELTNIINTYRGKLLKLGVEPDETIEFIQMTAEQVMKGAKTTLKDEQKIQYTKQALTDILVEKYQELSDVSDKYTKKLLDLGMDEAEAIKTVQMIADMALAYVNAEC